MKNKVVIVSNMYPSLSDPVYGSFVKEQTILLENQGVNIKRIYSTDRANRKKSAALIKYTKIWLKTLFAAFNPKNKVFHFHYVFPTALTAPILKKIFRKKIVLTFHGSDLLLRSDKKDRLMNLIVRNADEIIAVSDYLKDEFLSQFPTKEERAYSINCGVNLELFKPKEKEIIRERLGLNSEIFTVLYLSRLHTDKGIDTFEKIVDELKNDMEMQFLIVGDGIEKEELKRKYRDQRNVKLYNSVPKEEVADWMSAADVFLFPTKREAFGLVALESLACGTPVIANRVGGVGEIISDKQSGFLVDIGENNEKVYTQLILDLYEQPALRNSLGIEGYRSAQKHDISKQVDKVIAVYKKYV